MAHPLIQKTQFPPEPKTEVNGVDAIAFQEIDVPARPRLTPNAVLGTHLIHGYRLALSGSNSLSVGTTDMYEEGAPTVRAEDSQRRPPQVWCVVKKLLLAVNSFETFL